MNRRAETIKLLKQLLEFAEDETIKYFDWLRFGQLLLNSTPEALLYNLESPELLNRIEKYLEGQNEK